MTKRAVMESTSMPTEPSMKESGSMINSMDLELKFGKMVRSMKETIAMVVNTDSAATSGTMDPYSQEIGTRTKYMVWGLTNGLMVEVMRANGDRITWKGSVSTNGKTDEYTQENTLTTRSTDTEFINGRIPDNTLDIGQTESNTALVFTQF